MNTMITDAAVDAACRAYYDTADEAIGVDHTCMAAALEAALPHLAVVKQYLTAAPEAGNPVSVSERERFEAWGKMRFDRDASGEYVATPVRLAWAAWQAALAARQPEAGNPVSGLDFARQAIAYSHNFATAKPDIGATEKEHILGLCKVVERLIAARQPVGEVVAYIVPSAHVCHDGSYEDGPESVCLASDADDYVKRVGAPLYAAPPQQPAQAANLDHLRDLADMIDPERQADTIRKVVDGWSGWATQYPGQMPVLRGAREIAELNHYPEEGQRLIFLSEQPAQVDLGQFREAAYEAWKSAEQCSEVEAKIDRLLALIDSQGVK